MDLGDRLRVIRRENVLTQQDIADELHVSRQTVSGWETGRSYPDITSLITLAETYHLSLDTLLLEDTKVTADLVKQDQQRREARMVYYAVYAVDLVLVGLVVLNALKIVGFILPAGAQLVLTASMVLNTLALGPSYRRYRLLMHKKVDQTLTLGNFVLSVLVVVGLCGLMYGVLGGFSAEFWGGLIGGSVALVAMVVYHRVRFGPMRMTWKIK